SVTTFPSPSSLPFHVLCTAPAPAAIYTLSLHDALPISVGEQVRQGLGALVVRKGGGEGDSLHREIEGVRVHSGTLLWFRRNSRGDRKSTRLNSSHVSISYAVFCLKKKTNLNQSQKNVAK